MNSIHRRFSPPENANVNSGAVDGPAGRDNVDARADLEGGQVGFDDAVADVSSVLFDASLRQFVMARRIVWRSAP